MQILYQDQHLVVVDKPSGMLSAPGSLDECVLWQLEKQFPFVGLIHRLDQATSGVMVFALNKKAQSHLGNQFQYRETFKIYEALVHGTLPKIKGNIDLPLRCDWPNRPRQEVHPEGKNALTQWQCTEHLEKEVNGHLVKASRVLLIPHTGRSHQLRVHMMAMGHPILGDYFYAKDEALEAAPRLQLHAQSLFINHPITEQRMRFYSKAPF